jgi:hypothetical protein
VSAKPDCSSKDVKRRAVAGAARTAQTEPPAIDVVVTAVNVVVTAIDVVISTVNVVVTAINIVVTAFACQASFFDLPLLAPPRIVSHDVLLVCRRDG